MVCNDSKAIQLDTNGLTAGRGCPGNYLNSFESNIFRHYILRGIFVTCQFQNERQF